MSKPRQIIAGSTYHVSRRTLGRLYRLKPSPMVTQVFCFCLAYASSVYRIKVHAYCVMSNHYHIVLTDPEGNLPDFMSWFNEFVAKVLNVFWGEDENFWCGGSYSAVRLETPEDVIDKIVYTLSNPVASYLVSDARSWPGATSASIPYGAIRKYGRPRIFFRKNGPLPEESSLMLEVPSCFSGSPPEFKTLINERLRERQEEVREQAREQKRTFLGLRGIRAISHNDRPKSQARRRNLNPHVASKNASALQNAMFRLKMFRAEYADARSRFDAGEFNVIFPFGTFGLRKIVTVQNIPPPDIVWTSS